MYSGVGKRKGELYAKECRSCGADHGLSFAIGGLIPSGYQRPIHCCLDESQQDFQAGVGAAVLSLPDCLRRYQAQSVDISHNTQYAIRNTQTPSRLGFAKDTNWARFSTPPNPNRPGLNRTWGGLYTAEFSKTCPAQIRTRDQKARSHPLRIARTYECAPSVR